MRIGLGTIELASQARPDHFDQLLAALPSRARPRHVARVSHSQTGTISKSRNQTRLSRERDNAGERERERESRDEPLGTTRFPLSQRARQATASRPSRTRSARATPSARNRRVSSFVPPQKKKNTSRRQEASLSLSLERDRDPWKIHIIERCLYFPRVQAPRRSWASSSAPSAREPRRRFFHIFISRISVVFGPIRAMDGVLERHWTSV